MDTDQADPSPSVPIETGTSVQRGKRFSERHRGAGDRRSAHVGTDRCPGAGSFGEWVRSRAVPSLTVPTACAYLRLLIAPLRFAPSSRIIAEMYAHVTSVTDR